MDGRELYLLDANILIEAAHSYYPSDQVPEFWDWLLYKAELEEIKIPDEILDEVLKGNSSKEPDLLLAWLKPKEVQQKLRLNEEVDTNLVQKVLREGYAPDLNEVEIGKIDRDPFLIAYALASKEERTVVTAEKSSPNKTRGNRRVPDVCRSLAVKHCTVFEMNRRLGFKTSWNR